MYVYVYIYTYTHIHILMITTSSHTCLNVVAWAGPNLNVVTKTIVKNNVIKSMCVLTLSFNPMHLSDPINTLNHP